MSTTYITCDRCGATITADGPCDCHLVDTGRTPARDRGLVLTRASSITPRPVRWAWADRLPLGALALAAGREATGKSQFAAWLAAQITRGTLPGELVGRPRSVIYVAYEDSWAQTIVPRLIAAGADLDHVFKAAVRTVELDAETSLSLPVDMDALEDAIGATGTALLVVDPLLSTIHASIDSHKNRDVRRVLDPLAATADRTGCTVLGIAHFNKSAAGDASSAIVGSGAFKDAARAVLAFARDPESGDRVMTQSKNSLGSCDLASLAYVIEATVIATPEGDAHVSRLAWTGEAARTVDELMRDASGAPEDRADRDDAGAWAVAYLESRGGTAPFSEVITAAKAEGIAERTLRRARHRAGIEVTRQGFPATTSWAVRPQSGQLGQSPERGLTGRTGQTGRSAGGFGATCDQCGVLAARTVRHFATGAELCPTCCAEQSR